MLKLPIFISIICFNTSFENFKKNEAFLSNIYKIPKFIIKKVFCYYNIKNIVIISYNILLVESKFL